MAVRAEHMKQKLNSVKWVLGSMLVAALSLNVLMGQQYYTADKDNKRLEVEKEALQNDIECLEAREQKMLKAAKQRTDELTAQVTALKQDFKEKKDGVDEDLDALLADLDDIEFYPLYVELSRAGGAEPQDKLRD